MDHTAIDRTALALSDFAQDLTLDAVPERVQRRALHLMLDAIGCGLAARREDFASTLGDAIGSLGAGEAGRSGVVGHDHRLALRDAIWLNGVLMHGLDYDDTHMGGVVHLTVSVLPALMNLAAQRRASGSQLLVAYIAGVEAGARVASVVQGGLHAQGFHPTGVVGVFASAVAVGKLIGLSSAQLLAAQGIALSMASGSLQFLDTGAWTKRLQPGWAAQAGMQAARLAAHDFPAPVAPYEGRFGLFNAYLGESLRARIDLERGARGLGEAWEIEQVAIKPFPVCHFVHSAADAAIALRAQGVRAEDVVRIEARMPAGTMPVVCEPAEAKRRPLSDYDAKFSLHYAVASGLLRGRLGLQDLVPAAFTDCDALALMDRIECVIDPHATFPRHYGAELEATLRDGRKLVHREAINRGHAERPVTDAEVERKFLDNATLHFGDAFANDVLETVLDLRAKAASALEQAIAHDPQAVRAAEGVAS